jgi:ABC-type transport system involved in multi-copper enzyme maturation permease subunit
VVNTSLMTLGLGLALYCVGGKFERTDATILVAVYFILLELALVTALALFFSCFTSPMLSTLYTLGIYVAGVFAPGIQGVSQFTQNWALRAVTRFIYYLLPNFHDFGVIAAAAHGDRVPLALIWHNTLYAALYVALILLAASAVFSGRNLK